MKTIARHITAGLFLASGLMLSQTSQAAAEATYEFCIHTADKSEAGTNDEGIFVTLEGVGGFMQGDTRDKMPPNSFLANGPDDDFNRNTLYCQTLSESEARFSDIGAIHSLTLHYSRENMWCFDRAYVQYKLNGALQFQTNFNQSGCMSGESGDNASSVLALDPVAMPDLNIKPPKGRYVRASSGAEAVTVGVSKATISGVAHSDTARSEQQKQLSLVVGSEGKPLFGLFGKMNTSLTGTTTETQSKERMDSYNKELSVQQNCTVQIKKETDDIIWQWQEIGSFGKGKYTIQTCDFACGKTGPALGTTPLNLPSSYQCKS